MMGQHVSRTDFDWTYTEEPHASRRKVILGKCTQTCSYHIITERYLLIYISLNFTIAWRAVFFLEKYPQIKKLFGYDPNFKWVVTGMVLVQFASMFIVKDLSYPMLFLVAYCFGGVINHSLMLGMCIDFLWALQYDIACTFDKCLIGCRLKYFVLSGDQLNILATSKLCKTQKIIFIKRRKKKFAIIMITLLW